MKCEFVSKTGGDEQDGRGAIAQGAARAVARGGGSVPREWQRPSQFCLERGLDLARFYYWRRVFALAHSEASPESHFALVRRSAAAKESDGEAGLDLHVNRGWRLRIPRGVDEATLRMVLGALRQAR